MPTGFSGLFDNMSLFIVAIVTIPFLIIGLIFLVVALRGRRKVGKARGWPSTPGRVLYADVEMRRSHSSEGGYSTAYYPIILYEYNVGGQYLRSSKLYVGSEVGRGSYNTVAKSMQRYPVGGMVSVFYNPYDPTEAVLEQKAPANNIFLIIALLIFSILACTLVMTFGGFALFGQFMQPFMNMFNNVPR